MFIVNEDYEVILRGLEIMQDIDNFIACKKPDYSTYVILKRNWLQILEIVENKLFEGEDIATNGGDINE